MRILFILLFSCLASLSWSQTLPLHLLHLPPGFHVEIYAWVPNARSMTLGSKGTLFVGTLSEGNVYAVLPEGKGTRVFTIASHLTMPNGVAFHQGALYVAEMHRILRYDNIEDHLNDPPKPVVISTDLPNEKHHGWRFIDFGPDDKLYIAIGMPCNVCLPKDPRFGTISRMNPDGSHFEIYAKGIRNSVGFAWHPETKKLWFTDNGRDWMGDSLPPDKLNYAPQIGMDFGFPFFDSKNLPNPDYHSPSSSHITFPSLTLPAHVAVLGMTFYDGYLFPATYRNRVFIAEHGSWNRSTKVGYQVISANISQNKVDDVKPFMNGWLQGQKPWGRPVDVLVMPDGSLLVSDDFAGVIYRVTYKQ